MDLSNEYQDLCWQAGIATYPSIPRAGAALAGLLRWQGMRVD